jgi:hypothetical protein
MKGAVSAVGPEQSNPVDRTRQQDLERQHKSSILQLMGSFSSEATSVEMGRWSSNFALDKSPLMAQNFIPFVFGA